MHIPIVLTIIIVILITFSGLLEYLPLEPRKAFILIFVATLLPLQSYGHGKLKALRIKDGTSYTLLTSDLSSFNLKAKKENDLRYLGKAGSDIFIYIASRKEVIIFNRLSINPIKIKTSNQNKAFPSINNNKAPNDLQREN